MLVYGMRYASYHFLVVIKEWVGYFLFASLCCFLFVGKSYSCNLGFLNWVIALSGLFWPLGICNKRHERKRGLFVCNKRHEHKRGLLAFA